MIEFGQKIELLEATGVQNTYTERAVRKSVLSE